MKRYLMLLQVEVYNYYKYRLYYCASLKGLQYNLNIPVRRSRSSGELETACPELETALDNFFTH
jgi:hypothetical protein